MIRKALVLVVLFATLLPTLAMAAQSDESSKITGSVQEAGIWVGVGPYLKLREAPDKEFVLTTEQAIKAGIMGRKADSIYLLGESDWKGQTLSISYDKTVKEQWGTKYFSVISLEKSALPSTSAEKASKQAHTDTKPSEQYTWKDGFLEKDYKPDIVAKAIDELTNGWLPLQNIRYQEENAWVTVYATTDGNVEIKQRYKKNAQQITIGIKCDGGDKDIPKQLHKRLQSLLDNK